MRCRSFDFPVESMFDWAELVGLPGTMPPMAADDDENTMMPDVASLLPTSNANAAPKPVNQADLRKEARRIWPEWCDMDHDDWKTPGNIRKFCSRFAERYFPTATDQQAQQHVDQLTAQQEEQQVHQLADQQIEQRVNQLNDQQAEQETDHQDEQHGNQLTDQQADQQAHQHVNQLTDQQAGQQIAELIDHQAHQHVDELTDQQTETPFNQRTFGDILDEYPQTVTA
ncbi:hypothetical protein AC1031_010193 [Aphanomyces cochlioides]|nr:hypothetical protein AC1031_010193 [Aphanomyces cochlioides]